MADVGLRLPARPRRHRGRAGPAAGQSRRASSTRPPASCGRPARQPSTARTSRSTGPGRCPTTGPTACARCSRLACRWARSALHGVLRARLDAGSPRAATARSAASGPGVCLLVERGSLGRTSPLSALDAGVRIRARLGRRRLWLALEGFGLTQHRPVVARDAVFTDAVVAPTAGGRVSSASRGARSSGGPGRSKRRALAAPIAYAEPLAGAPVARLRPVSRHRAARRRGRHDTA